MRFTSATTLAVALALAACGGREGQEGQQEQQQAAPDSIARARAAADSVARIRAQTEEVRTMVAQRIHFNFDRAQIRPAEDTRIMEQKVAILQANPGLRVEITGHCDERGPRAYNQALGMRRADAAKRLLTSRGIAADRITTRSRGEDEPLNPARNREAWAQNRRAEFAITAGGDRLVRPAR